MWELYDELIEGIPSGIIVDDYVFGGHFSMLRAGGGEFNGVAHSFAPSGRPFLYDENPVGRDLKDVARAIKSWNFKEATLGMCAVNAYYNSRANVTALGIDAFDNEKSCLDARIENNPLHHKEDMAGKKVAVIGHFPGIERNLVGICDLYILEQNPQEGDYPASACEDLIPQMDAVYATGMTIANKTLPRLLELRRKDAVFTLVGPSGPLSPVMHKYGVDNVASYVVVDPEYVWDVLGNDKRGMFSGGKMVEFKR